MALAEVHAVIAKVSRASHMWYYYHTKQTETRQTKLLRNIFSSHTVCYLCFERLVREGETGWCHLHRSQCASWFV